MKTGLILALAIITWAAEAAKPQPTPTPAPVQPAVNGLTCDGAAFNNGAVLALGVNHTITALVNTATLSVVFVKDAQTVKTDTAIPFDYAWSPGQVGPHTIQVTPRNATVSGVPLLVNFSVAAATPTPTPIPTVSPTITPTATPSPTVSVTPSPTPPSPTATPTPTPTPAPTATPTPSPTATATVTPTSTPSATPSPTPSPSPTPTPTPAQISFGAATVSWTATAGHCYMILYGKTNPPQIQVDGGNAIFDGPMQVTVSGLEPATTYYFSDVVLDNENDLASPPLPPIQYQTP